MATEHDYWDQMCANARTSSLLWKPKLSIDGNQWCALYGDNLQDGVAGFGDTPALAMHDFDCNWLHSKPFQAAEAVKGEKHE